MTQGERIKQIRTSLNMTLEKFGERLGVTKTAISYIETNKRNVTDQMLRAICREFNVDYDWLVYGTGDNMFSELPETILDELCRQYDLDAIDRRLIQEYVKLDKQSRQVLKDYIKKVAEDK